MTDPTKTATNTNFEILYRKIVYIVILNFPLFCKIFLKINNIVPWFGRTSNSGP